MKQNTRIIKSALAITFGLLCLLALIPAALGLVDVPVVISPEQLGQVADLGWTLVPWAMLMLAFYGARALNKLAARLAAVDPNKEAELARIVQDTAKLEAEMWYYRHVAKTNRLQRN